MANWKLVTGEVSGKCPQCNQYLRHSDTVFEWRGGKYHEGCLLDLLTAIAPAYYSSPGTDWQAP